MRNIWWAVGVLFLAFAGTAGAAGEAAPTLAPDDIIVGKADAPVTIFEYASLTCPHCAEFDTDILPKVKAEWIDHRQGKLIFRDYPLDGLAVKAAMLARCARRSKFSPSSTRCSTDQRDWVLNSDPLAALKRIGLLGGIGPEKFDACMKDKSPRGQASSTSGSSRSNQYGVNSTPTFFINGKQGGRRAALMPNSPRR